MAPSSLPLLLATFAFLHTAAAAEHGVSFAYDDGLMGPENWGTLKPHYGNCSSGKQQSPINIVTDHSLPYNNLKPLAIHYPKTVNATLIHHGYGIGAEFQKESGVLEIDGKDFHLSNMHWHCPSEHRINRLQFPAELHVVHKAEDGSIAVVGILYRYGKEDPLISKISDKLEEMAMEKCGVGEDSHIDLGEFRMDEISRKSGKYYRYVGSLTTPPCTQNIIWTVLGKVRPISRNQVRSLKAPLGRSFQSNSRPLQPLNGRNVKLYEDVDDH